MNGHVFTSPRTHGNILGSSSDRRPSIAKSRRPGMILSLGLAVLSVLALSVTPSEAQLRLYIPNFADDTVSVIEADGGNSVIATLSVGDQPFGVAVSPDGSTVAVTCLDATNSVAMIDTATNGVTFLTNLVGSSLFGVTFSPDNSTLWVTSSGGTFFSAPVNNAAASATSGSGTHGIVLNAAGTIGYAAHGSGFLVVNSPLGAVPPAFPSVGTSPWGIELIPDESKVYLSNFGATTVSVMDTGTNTISTTITVGGAPTGVVAHPSLPIVYVANSDSDTVSIISTTTDTETGTISVGDGPFGLDISPAGDRLYTTNFNTGTVSIVDTGSNLVVDTVTVGGQPYALGRFVGLGTIPVRLTGLEID